MNPTRRQLLSGIAFSGATLFLNSCVERRKPSPRQKASDDEEKKGGGEVTAVEDLMREHGVLRRALLVYAETAPKPGGVSPAVVMDGLQKTARLFRDFGEDYHEKKLEETLIFPAVRNAGHSASSIVDTLVAQHQRGREITDFILSATRRAKLGSKDAEILVQVMGAFVRMYQNHAAREDTLIFPAWKQVLSADRLDDMAEKFEDIEYRQFGKNGFEGAVRKIGEIEEALGLADLAQFTAPLPTSG
jgi:hemerythrin-like domain-containing protein